MEAERTAIALLKAGQIDGLRILVERYQVQAVRAATLIVRDPSAAEDLVQEAFLRVYERIGQFDSERPFKPWFFRIVINAAIKAAERQQRSISIEPADEADYRALVAQLEAASERPEDRLEQAELREKIQKALGRLTPTQRAIVVKRYYLDFNDQELAEELDLAPGTIRWHLSTIRRRLRGLLSFDK